MLGSAVADRSHLQLANSRILVHRLIKSIYDKSTRHGAGTLARHYFINYRKSLNLTEAQLLHVHLERYLGRKRVFIDISGLEGGDHWLQSLERQVANSIAMVVLIDKNWLTVIDEQGNYRLQQSSDFVRFEVEQALLRNIPVIPLLLDGAQMPTTDDLPAGLAQLPFQQAMTLRQESFEKDAAEVAKRLKYFAGISRSPKGVPVWATALTSVLFLVLGAIVGPWALQEMGVPRISFDSAQVDAAGRLDDLLKQKEKNIRQRENEVQGLQERLRTLDGKLMKQIKENEELREASVIQKNRIATLLSSRSQNSTRVASIAASKPLETYTVRSGDSLYAIARKHNMEIEDLRRLNQALTARELRPGQQLNVHVPGKRPPHTKRTPAHSDGIFRWPLRGKIISKFGRQQNGTRNDGIKLLAPEGTDIHAAGNGIVAYAGDDLRGYGNLVLIRHDGGYVTAYAHASSILVKRGDEVESGQVIAKVGSTGSVDVAQLHFEVRQGARPIDPLPFLNAKAKR